MDALRRVHSLTAATTERGPPDDSSLTGSEKFAFLDHLHNRSWHELLPGGVAGLDFAEHVARVDRQQRFVNRDRLDELVFEEVRVKMCQMRRWCEVGRADDPAGRGVYGRADVELDVALKQL